MRQTQFIKEELLNVEQSIRMTMDQLSKAENELTTLLGADEIEEKRNEINQLHQQLLQQRASYNSLLQNAPPSR